MSSNIVWAAALAGLAVAGMWAADLSAGDVVGVVDAAARLFTVFVGLGE